MKILLTGGAGSVGKAVVDRLVAKGHSVVVIGRRPGLEFKGAEYQSCDINDYPHLRKVIRGCDAVVHLAAIPNPSKGTPEQIFTVNVSGTFNVFRAAEEEGIRRVVQASSINAIGQFYGVKPAPLNYLPMDEDHPVFSSDAYSFSKHMIEDIGAFFWRRAGISSVALRLPYVAAVNYHEIVKSQRTRVKKLVERLSQYTDEERLAWFERTWKIYNDFRATRPYEGYSKTRDYINNLSEEEYANFSAMSNRVNFFTVLDERDSAQSIEKGLHANFTGSHVLFVNDHSNWTGVDSKILAEYFYPDVGYRTKELNGTETLVSIDRAREVIGFEPEFSFDERKGV